jgi:CRP-like cAMP-binding protein
MSYTLSRETAPSAQLTNFRRHCLVNLSATVLVSMTRQEFQQLISESPQAATVLLDFLIRMGLATHQCEYTDGRRCDVYLFSDVVRQGLGCL